MFFLSFSNIIKKNLLSLKKKLKKYVPFLYFLAYSLYCLSLEKCNEGFDLCSLRVFWIKTKIFEVVAFCFIIVIILELMFYKIVSLLNLIHLALFYYAMYIYSHGVDFEDHGYYNFIGSIAIIIILILSIIPLNSLLFIINLHNKKYLFIFIICIFNLLSMYFYFSNYYVNCNDWKYGLNNSFIDNDINKYSCSIIFPKTCYYKVGKYFLDKSRLRNTSCHNKDNTKANLIKHSTYKYINDKTKLIGFPLTKYNKLVHSLFINNSRIIKNYINDNIIDANNKTLLKNIYGDYLPEIIVDYENNNFGELKINIQFNKTLSEERKLSENNTIPYSDNIIIIFIDSVSRAYSIRSLKKTLNFIEQFMSYKGSHNKNYPSENFHSFQFFKYHSFNYYTRYNYIPLIYGRVHGKLQKNIRFFKDNGYITCFVNDMCLKEPSNLEINLTDYDIADHEYLMCDPNADSIFLTSKRCLYGKITSHHAFEYGIQFWKKYKENRKYLNINIEDGHEGTLEVLKYTDKIIYHFLKKLYDENLMMKTSIVLYPIFIK